MEGMDHFIEKLKDESGYGLIEVGVFLVLLAVALAFLL
jgi:Flp pilus assembly pilin Flp